ncbi:PDDEXK nuclease domain-containing protein [Syntrophorhabdus aromaticivorans]|nr:PDDEXK nuclease domain-containing protein [Syntrophorhabdus aromaticivorans]
MKKASRGSSVKTKNQRRVMGRSLEDVAMPVAEPLGAMPKRYPSFFEEIKERIARERIQSVLAASAAMVLMYWDIGRQILEKQEAEGWGAKVVDRLSHDLKATFPDMHGFSPRNLKYMRKFAESWPDRSIVQQTVAQIPWGSNLALLDKLQDAETRLWYARKTVEYGWGRNMLAIQIETRRHEREGKAINNFPAALPPLDSDMAEQAFKDPYIFDFLGTADLRREAELERKLVDHIQQFLLELGQGFAFVGRQVHMEVGGSDFYIDLLFYHLKLRCYVVVELKVTKFDPGYVSKLNMYLNIVDDLLRHPDDKPSIGLLLVKEKNQTIVEYSLAGYRKPIGVAEWQREITRSLPEELKSSLPTIEEIEAELEGSAKEKE